VSFRFADMAALTSGASAFQVDREDDHSGLNLVKYVGKFQVFIPGMDVSKPITDLDLGRENETLEKEVKPDSEFCPVIIALDLDQLLGSFGACIAGHVDVSFDAGQCVHPEIPDSIALKFQLDRERHDHGFNGFADIGFSVDVGLFEFVENIPLQEHELWIEAQLKTVG